MSLLKLHAPAKVNLSLRVIGKRSDGYHLLRMVMVKLKLGDELTFESLPQGIEFTTIGELDAGMSGDQNLVVRAAKALQMKTGVKQGARITLTKQTPVAAGLGGGSSDAATALMGLNTLWGCHLASTELAKIGETLGADVPFFCFPGSALVEGIGEQVIPLASMPLLNLVLINPGFAVSTKWVFGELQKWFSQLTVENANDSNSPLFQTVEDVCQTLHNDLEMVTIPAYPEIVRIKSFLKEQGAAGTLMSGSGPTVFGIFADEASRDRAAYQARQQSSTWRVFATETL
ncbi:MAG: 4-(cytidine 5'-diphospho)-2-C-methyl-D-erythritol kinase [Deltaproteobacteria bacterium]|nr:4-(cytidine 5'-diphospho)-2-C-methyl-D-erythritol kinase [Deltaproteobacteria bacterium]